MAVYMIASNGIVSRVKTSQDISEIQRKSIESRARKLGKKQIDTPVKVNNPQDVINQWVREMSV